jgi:hypothetical protein
MGMIDCNNRVLYVNGHGWPSTIEYCMSMGMFGHQQSLRRLDKLIRHHSHSRARHCTAPHESVVPSGRSLGSNLEKLKAKMIARSRL